MRGKVGVIAYRDAPIDIELPASVSGQHVVSFLVRLDVSASQEMNEQTAGIVTRITLPVHVRYPKSACERRGGDCDGYSTVEVSKEGGPALGSWRLGWMPSPTGSCRR